MSTNGLTPLSNVPPLLELFRASKYFGRTVALRDVSLQIRKGERWVIFGRNGAGKTTLLRVLAGLMRPSSGEIRLEGKPFAEQEEALRGQIGFLSHATSLYGDLTAEENLLFYARLYRIEDFPGRIGEMLHQVGLEERSSEPVRGFSRGMQQRLGIARAFLHQPRILIFDEPYTGLDAPSVELLRALIDKAEGITLLLASHDLDRGMALADHAAILDRGRLMEQREVDPGQESAIRAAYARWVEGKAGS